MKINEKNTKVKVENILRDGGVITNRNFNGDPKEIIAIDPVTGEIIKFQVGRRMDTKFPQPMKLEI